MRSREPRDGPATAASESDITQAMIEAALAVLENSGRLEGGPAPRDRLLVEEVLEAGLRARRH